MANLRVIGKVVGLPSCADPATTGLTFKVNDGSKVWDFRVAGNGVPKQSPNTALCMSALLAAASLRGANVLIEAHENAPDIAVLAGVPAEAFGIKESEAIGNPFSGKSSSLQVWDFNDTKSTGIATNVRNGHANPYFESAEQDRVVHWMTLLALAYSVGATVTIGYRIVKERQITSLKIGI